MGNAVTKVEAGGLHTNKASQTQVLDIPFKPNRSSLRSVSRRDLSLLAGLSLLLHGGIWWYINNAPAEQLETPPKIPEMVVEFSSPTPPAPPAPQPTPAPPAPKAPPAPPAPPAPVKETAAVSGLASLGNPPPEYPSLALRRGWEGSVTLRIRVLPNGRAGSVDVTKSSGKKQLDDAAVEAVRGWKFIPAKRGDTPIEGFATQTIDFKLPQ
ncbi:energy transducer TonB [Pseudomonas luteola]|uniref:energy transducer TonB n=1 Tax=Pseudomonas luteola TaxID=47886 RepID=UPI0015E3B292|nr:energy transducer TonB [Pseudomonas zeshuii]MBA1248668.1 energy transducer TonB [Pseudomonas zeshuii]